MSHSHKDSVGGHVGSWIGVGMDGVMNNGPLGRRFAKKWNRREARREMKRVVAQSLQDLEDDYQQALVDLREAFEYELEYEMQMWEEYCEPDDELYREDLLTSQQFDYDYDYDYGWDDWTHDDLLYYPVVVAREPEVDPFADSGESLGDILARAMVEGRQVGEEQRHDFE